MEKISRKVCPACDCADNEPLFSSGGRLQLSSVVTCLSCRTIFNKNPSTQSVFQDLSTHVPAPKEDWENSNHKLDAYRLGLSKIGISFRGSRLLDFGCGAGAFVRYARGLGYEAFGYEPSGYQRSKIDDEKSIIYSTLPNDQYFNIVTAWDVVEHLRSPLEQLKLLRSRVLAPGGVVCFCVPSAEGVRLKLRASVNISETVGELEFDEHVQYLTKNGIEQLLSSAGFSSISVEACPVYKRKLNPSELLRRILWPIAGVAGYPLQHIAIGYTRE